MKITTQTGYFRGRILFVCIGNTCRSQMAEGFARAFGDGSFEVASAGTNAAGYVNAETAEAMMELSIDISGQTSDQLTLGHIDWADTVVTLGCQRAELLCPPSFKGRKIDWPIEDPLGRAPEVLRRVRDDIGKRVRLLLEEYGSEHTGS